MPKADMGQEIRFGRGNILKLKSKDEKVRFRFAGGAVYDGKHYIEGDGDNKDVSYCPRIMKKQDCQYCALYFAAQDELKEEKDQKKKKLLDAEVRKYRVSISFYYPILDRDDGKAKILRTTMSVRQKVEEEFKAEVDVMGVDHVLTRNEGSPANYYSLVPIDSKNTKPLTTEEEAEFAKAKAYDLEKILGHDTVDSSLNMGGEGQGV